MDKEEIYISPAWKKIPGYAEKYRVNNQGDVISVLNRPGSKAHGRVMLLKKNTTDGPRQYVTIENNEGEYHQVAVCRLVLFAFEGVKELEVLFRDGDRGNTQLSNLYYCEEPNLKSTEEKWVPLKNNEFGIIVSNKGRMFKKPSINFEGKSLVGRYIEPIKLRTVWMFAIPVDIGKSTNITLNKLLKDHFDESEYDLEEVKRSLN